LRGKLNQFLDLAAGLNTKKVVYFTAINKMCQCRGCDEDTAYLQGLGEGLAGQRLLVGSDHPLILMAGISSPRTEALSYLRRTTKVSSSWRTVV
jgi:hypothetical protein